MANSNTLKSRIGSYLVRLKYWLLRHLERADDKPPKRILDTTLREYADRVISESASMGFLELKNGDGGSTAAFIFVHGIAETQKILDAVESVERGWKDEREAAENENG